MALPGYAAQALLYRKSRSYQRARVGACLSCRLDRRPTAGRLRHLLRYRLAGLQYWLCHQHRPVGVPLPCRLPATFGLCLNGCPSGVAVAAAHRGNEGVGRRCCEGNENGRCNI